MNKRLEAAIDQAIREVLLENPATVRDRDGVIVDCGHGPAVAFKMYVDTHDNNKIHFTYNDRRHTDGPAWHGEIRMSAPGMETLRGRLWSDEKVASFYQSQRLVAQYHKEVEDFFDKLGEDINTYRWDFDDSAETEGLIPWPWKHHTKSEEPAIQIPPEIQKKINDILPQFHLAAPGPEKDKLKSELDALYKQAGVENQKERQATAYRKASATKLDPYEKGGGGSVAGYRGRLPALQENPDTMRDVKTGLKCTVYDGPAISFYCIADDNTGKHQWYFYRNDHGSAWHNDITRRATRAMPNPWGVGSDRYLRGRIWQREKVCSFYMTEDQFKAKEIARVEELFDLLNLDINEFKFEFSNSARTEGLKPWIGTPKASEPPKVELSPEEQKKIDAINKQIAELQATLHLKTGAEKDKVEREIERLEAMVGKIGGAEARKAAYRKAGAEKLSPYEKGGGSVAGYRGRLPAIAEDAVRLYNKTLCPKLWTSDNPPALLPDVRSALLQIALDFYTDTELTGKIQDVQLLGSAANYNWTPKSDLDVHILVDGSQVSMKPEDVEKYFRSMVGKWNLEHDIVVKGHPVELYLQDVKDENAATAIYSLLRSQWVKEPVPQNISVDKQEIQKKYTMWVEKINAAIKSNDEKQLKKILDGLRDCRQAGLDERGEFSTENLVFKILRARGFLEKLKDAANSIYDKKMTVKDGFEPTSQGPNPGAGQEENDTGQFYQRTNDRMRQMEGIGMKDLKSRHPQFAVMTDNPDLKKLTLDNLKSLRDKAMRFYMAAKQAKDDGEMERAKAVYQMFHTEIKKRLDYINKPMDEAKEPLHKDFKIGRFTVKFGEPDIVRGAGKAYIGDEVFMNVVKMPADYGKYGNKWVVNKDVGAFRMGLKEWPKGYDTPEELVQDLDKWVSQQPMKEGTIDWVAWEKEKNADVDSIPVPGTNMRMAAKKQRPPSPDKYQDKMSGFGGDPEQAQGRSSEPRRFEEKALPHPIDYTSIPKGGAVGKAFWVSPDGKMYEVKISHTDFMNRHFQPSVDSKRKAIERGWVRIRTENTLIDVEPDLNKISPTLKPMIMDFIKRQGFYVVPAGSLSEGYGAGNPEEDRLKIRNSDDSVRRWQVRSKDAPKTPKMTKEVMEMVNEALDTVLPEVITEGELLLEHPLVKTLKKNKEPLTDEERKEVMRKGAVWHHGPKGEKTPAVWKSVVNGKTWYACNTHRAIQVKSTLKAAIRAFSFIKTTA